MFAYRGLYASSRLLLVSHTLKTPSLQANAPITRTLHLSIATMVRRSARASASASINYAEPDVHSDSLAAAELAPPPKRARKAVKEPPAKVKRSDSGDVTPSRATAREVADTIIKDAASPPPTPRCTCAWRTGHGWRRWPGPRRARTW